MHGQQVSSIERVPISYFVYSAFSFYGTRRGAELPGSWLVRAIESVGRNPDAIRQTLYRMEHDGELTARQVRRTKFYAPTSYARAEIEAGTEKIFEEPDDDWDGAWTFVHVGLRTPALARHRERVVALLAVEGFARLDANAFVHPRDVTTRLREALPAAVRRDVIVGRSPLAYPEAIAAVISRWPITSLERRYLKAERLLEGVRRTVQHGVSDEESFRLRFAVVFDFLAVAWDDPGLPRAVLPKDWPATRVRKRTAELYARLLPAALRHADALYAETEAHAIAVKGT